MSSIIIGIYLSKVPRQRQPLQLLFPFFQSHIANENEPLDFPLCHVPLVYICVQGAKVGAATVIVVSVFAITHC
jgi:hypothetical protein